MLSLYLPGAIPADTCRHLHLNARVSGIIQVYIYIYFFFLSFLLLLPTVEFSHFQRFHTWD